MKNRLKRASRLKSFFPEDRKLIRKQVEERVKRTELKQQKGKAERKLKKKMIV